MIKAITFFETSETEEQYLRKNFEHQFKLKFFSSPIQGVEKKYFIKSDAISVFIYSRVEQDLLS